jgi:hypothetical protein
MTPRIYDTAISILDVRKSTWQKHFAKGSCTEKIKNSKVSEIREGIHNLFGRKE